MVEVKIFREKGPISGFEISGHAIKPGLLSKNKFDLVCAGVSSVSITALNGLVEYLGIRLENPQCEDGYIHCMLPADIEDIQDLKAQAILETMVLGLQEIAKDFPKYVKFV